MNADAIIARLRRRRGSRATGECSNAAATAEEPVHGKGQPSVAASVRIPETDQQIRQRVERQLAILQELCAANSAKYNSAPGDNFDFSTLPPQAKAQVVPSASSQCPKEPVTLFHSAHVPPVTLQALLDSVCHRRTWCSFTAAEVAVTLFLQYGERTGLPCTELMMHRLYVACVLVAAKALQDFVPTNEAVAKASGLAVAELCRLELMLLRGLDWRAIPSPEQMAATERKLAPPPRVIGSHAAPLAAIHDERHSSPLPSRWNASTDDDAFWMSYSSAPSCATPATGPVDPPQQPQPLPPVA